MDKVKKIGLFFILFFIFLVSDLFYLIPLKLLNIDFNTLNYTTKMLLTIGSNFILVLIFIFIYKNYLKEKLIDFKNNFKEYFDLGFKWWFVGLIGMCVTNLLIALFTPVKEANNEVLVQQMLNQAPLLSFISATFLAPFLEEMLFRKCLGDTISNKKLMPIISGLIFGLLHVVFSLETGWDLLYTIPYGLLGFGFAMILSKKENVFIPIFFHMLHNGILTLLSIL